jgi:hypothetical protein
MDGGVWRRAQGVSPGSSRLRLQPSPNPVRSPPSHLPVIADPEGHERQRDRKRPRVPSLTMPSTDRPGVFLLFFGAVIVALAIVALILAALGVVTIEHTTGRRRLARRRPRAGFDSADQARGNGEWRRPEHPGRAHITGKGTLLGGSYMTAADGERRLAPGSHDLVEGHPHAPDDHRGRLSPDRDVLNVGGTHHLAHQRSGRRHRSARRHHRRRTHSACLSISLAPPAVRSTWGR